MRWCFRGKHERREQPNNAQRTELTALEISPIFIAAKEDAGAHQPATTGWEGEDGQQMASVGHQDGDFPIFLRSIHPLNVPRKDDNLVPQSLNPAYKRPDAWPTGREK